MREQPIITMPETTPIRKPEILRMREASGNVKIAGRLVAFLYSLMIGEVTPGRLEIIMHSRLPRDPETEVQYTNGWLALHAKDIAERLTGEKIEPPVRRCTLCKREETSLGLDPEPIQKWMTLFGDIRTEDVHESCVKEIIKHDATKEILSGLSGIRERTGIRFTATLA